MAVVVIDPGHGGDRPVGGSSPNNATGPAGTLEKTLTLERARLAKAAGAAAFVSIHFNGFSDPRVQGTETWVHRLASPASRDLAGCVQRALLTVTRYHDRGVQAKTLGVLDPAQHLTTTAACLAEVSFITNAGDERRLQDLAYRRQLGEGIARGITDYLRMTGRRTHSPSEEESRMAEDSQTEFTVEELLAELRARERARVAAPAGRALDLSGPSSPERASATGVVARFHKLEEIPSAELARRANALQRSIYGVDDRRDIYEVTDKRARPLINASLALVERSDLHKGADGKWTLRTTSYQADYKLCAKETFASQPLGCFCSGVLIAPDVVATAGHCVKSTADLAHIRFVFGFRMEDAATARTTFSDDEVYTGKEVIGRKLTDDRTDWALIRLDRRVTGRRPVAFRATGKIKSAAPLFVIGHPCGLPQKLAGGARVKKNGDAAFFVANLDTYGGNSGSPVFSGTNYELEGLLVRGQKDFVSTGHCYVSMTYPTTGPDGEDVTRTTEWTSLVPKKGGAASRAGKPAKRTRKSASTTRRAKRRAKDNARSKNGRRTR